MYTITDAFKELNKKSSKKIRNKGLNEDLNAGESWPNAEHFPKTENEFEEMFEDAENNVFQLRTEWDSYIMYEAIDLGAWGGEFTFESYVDASIFGSDDNRLSLEDYLDNVYSRIVSSGDYDEAADEIDE